VEAGEEKEGKTLCIRCMGKKQNYPPGLQRGKKESGNLTCCDTIASKGKVTSNRGPGKGRLTVREIFVLIWGVLGGGMKAV